jgi:methylmalonyl-CoA/ethylmalonyl-CoA epimerase
MPRVKSINHVAMVVADMNTSLSFWRDALGLEVRGLRDVPAESSRIAFLPLAGSQVELVLPTSADSGVAKFLGKRGPGMHHICLEVDDLDTMLGQLKARGIRLIHEEALDGAAGVKYAFVHPESTGGVLVELYQI